VRPRWFLEQGQATEPDNKSIEQEGNRCELLHEGHRSGWLAVQAKQDRLGFHY